MRFLYLIGQYVLFMAKVFSRPQRGRMTLRRAMQEMWSLGVGSIPMVALISVFIGAVITLQTAYNVENPLLPKYLVGLAARDSVILEFSSTMVCLILAGKVGSNIASEIGTMRITEQIDALEIMGVNAASFLVLPKVVGLSLFGPVLYVLSVSVGLFGGYLSTVLTGAIPPGQYLYGIRAYFIPYYLTYSAIKMVVFCFIITSVAAFYGYHVRGGSLEVGRASTRAVVNSSIAILIFNLILTQLLLP